MYNGLLHLHSLLRWVILILLILAIVKHYTGMKSAKLYSNGDKKIGLFLMITAHITLLIGLYQWFVGPLGLKTIMDLGIGEVMKNKGYRFFAIEHFTGMLIGIVLITLGRGVGKKNLPDQQKHQKSFRFYLIALVIIFASIPWPFRGLEIARPLFPGMH
jgi:hypothetical protein